MRSFTRICAFTSRVALALSLAALPALAQDQAARGKVIDYRCALEIGGVRIEPGTLLFGDKEGVLVIPAEAEEEVVRLALEKVRGEKLVAKAIREGMSAVEAYKTFGIM